MEILEFFIENYYAATFLLIGTIVFATIMSLNVKATFSKYEKIRSKNGVPAHIIARQILDSNGLYNIAVVPFRGKLTDHYDPRKQIVALSESVYNSTSVSAIGVAAHECGHAVQHAKEYTPIKIRTAIVPVVQIANYTWMFMIIIGMFMYLPGMINIGIAFFTISAVFQLVTLPVEFDASKRAMATIEQQNILDKTEQKGARKTLSAAAMTYVAAFLVSLAQLIRLLALANRRR
ncbi:MAG: zinc metallopeptidase [Oscillospiraceae bacterium]|nr:zinc metallopeptidase [Oscillospiraceae bacterium]